jgi:hypothetical protein
MTLPEKIFFIIVLSTLLAFALFGCDPLPFPYVYDYPPLA